MVKDYVVVEKDAASLTIKRTTEAIESYLKEDLLNEKAALQAKIAKLDELLGEFT